ncbi:MAG: VOC family protein [Haloferacaceae archaeon]
MADLHRIEHAILGVEDLDRAVEFYTGPMGLVEQTREDGVVYLGCGRDDNYDMGVVEAGTGVEHFAVRAIDAEVVDDYENRLQSLDVDAERTDGDEPGQEAGVRFDLPSGASMEIVAVADDRYQHYEEVAPGRGGQAPWDVDHIQLLTPDIVADVEFLRDVVDMHVSEIAGPREDPEIAFVRCNVFHHDVALKSASALGEREAAGLHHLAWGFDDVGHLTRFVDRIAGAGCDLERGIGRHHGGNNIFAYFWEPGGNRFELCTQMATLSRTEPEHAEDYESTTTAWGPEAPPSFGEGSGLVDLE